MRGIDLRTMYKAGLICLLFLCANSMAYAALVISEDFDYATGNLAGNNGGSGWGGAWTFTDPDGTATVTAAGLTFSDMPVSGRAVQIQQTATGFHDVTAKRAVGVSVAAGEDLWVSFLYQQPDAPLASNASRTAEIRHSGLKMRIKPKNSGSQGIGFRYNSSGGTAANGTKNVQSGDTFMVVARFGDVGQATGKVGLMWVLEASDYDSIMLAGVTQGALDANNLLALSSPHANKNLLSGDLLEILVADSSNTNFTAIYDEFRYGTSVEDVVPVAIPEPAAATLVGLALSFCMPRRRTRC